MHRKKILLIIGISFLVFSCGDSMRKEFREAENLRRSKKEEDWVKAVRKYERIMDMKIEVRDKQAQVYRRLGSKFEGRGMWNDALEQYQLALQITPAVEDIHYRSARCYSELYLHFSGKKEEKQKLLNRALEAYRMVLSLNPSHRKAQYWLGFMEFMYNKNYAEGISLMEGLLEREKKNTDSLFALGRFHYELGTASRGSERLIHLESARIYYNRLKEILPQNSERWEQAVVNEDRIEQEINAGP